MHSSAPGPTPSLIVSGIAEPGGFSFPTTLIDPDLAARITATLSTWLVTGAAGFIGSNLVEALLKLDQRVVGLRYFNVFGPRQDPDGAYAAVIPKWIAAMIRGEDVFINGDGSTSRDFCFVANVVQANLRAALADDAARDQVCNVAVGGRTDLNDLFATLRDTLAAHGCHYDRDPVYRDLRAGDVRHL